MRNPPSMILGCGALLALGGIAMFAAWAFAGIWGMNRLTNLLLALGGAFSAAGLIGIVLIHRCESPHGK